MLPVSMHMHACLMYHTCNFYGLDLGAFPVCFNMYIQWYSMLHTYTCTVCTCATAKSRHAIHGALWLIAIVTTMSTCGTYYLETPIACRSHSHIIQWPSIRCHCAYVAFHWCNMHIAWYMYSVYQLKYACDLHNVLKGFIQYMLHSQYRGVLHLWFN